MKFREAVYAMVSEIPPGFVMTYGQVSACLGVPRAARAVGTALKFLPKPNEVPWWRVINAAGGISTRHIDQPNNYQRRLLWDEGLEDDDYGHFDLRRYRWWPPDELEERLRVSPEGAEFVGSAFAQQRGSHRSSGRISSPARRI